MRKCPGLAPVLLDHQPLGSRHIAICFSRASGFREGTLPIRGPEKVISIRLWGSNVQIPCWYQVFGSLNPVVSSLPA